MAKQACPVSRGEFELDAEEIVLTGVYRGQEVRIVLQPNVPEDATKSMGWMSGDVRGTIKVAGKQVPIYGSANLWCVGSKRKA